MAKNKSHIVGRWRNISMTECEQGFVDEEVPGYFEFRRDGLGDFQFGYVQGQIDWRDAERDRRTAVEFTFEGMEEMTPNSGRSLAIIEGDTPDGMIFFHQGDESAFTAKIAESQNNNRLFSQDDFHANKCTHRNNHRRSCSGNLPHQYSATNRLHPRWLQSQPVPDRGR